MPPSGQISGFRVRPIDLIVAIVIGSTLIASLVLGVAAIYSATLGFERPLAELVALTTVVVPLIPLGIWFIVRHRGALAEIERAKRIERALLERGGDLIVGLDRSGAILSAAGSLAERLGCADPKLVVGDWRRWMHPDDRARCETQLARCLEQRSAGSILYRGIGADGHRLSIEATVFPLTDADGQPDGFVVRHRDVSGAAEVRDELADQAERMALAQRAGRVGVWEYSTADRRLVLSELLRQMLGLAADADCSIDTARRWLDAEQLRELEIAVRRSFVHHADVSLALVVTPPDGVTRRVAITATAARDATGRIVRVIGTAVDISEQARQRELLARSEWTLVSFIEHAPVALVMCDRSLRCVRASRHWCELFAAGGAAPEGRLLREILPGPWSHWSASCDDALDGIPQRRAEDAVPTVSAHTPGDASATESVRWLRWEMIPWPDEAGAVGGIILMFEDIGPRKEAEQAVVAVRESLDASEAAARVGSWRYDLRSGLVSWSRETYRLFGRDPAEPTPDYPGILATYESSSAARLDAAVRRAVSEMLPYDIVVQLRTSANGVRFVNARGRPLLSDDGTSVEGLAGTVRDVTAEVERQEDLRRAREAAEEGNRAKGEFLASMGHEIRTPLTAILGYAELLASDEEIQRDGPRRQTAAETIRHNARHLLALINDLLDLSKIEAGKLVIEHLPTNVTGVTADVLHLLGPAARTKGLEIVSQITLEPKQLVLTDPIRLRQVLVNLLGNAIKFTERGSVTLTASLVRGASDVPDDRPSVGPLPPAPVDAQRGELAITVADTGIGMTRETLQRIFGAFEQADASTSRRYGGTGLGLRISRRLAELLGGRLEVESNFGTGSSFTLRLPVAILPPRERAFLGGGRTGAADSSAQR